MDIKNVSNIPNIPNQQNIINTTNTRNTRNTTNIPNIINQKYKIIEKIGQGTFGTIYKGQNIRTSEQIAIKVEPIENQTKLIKNESIIYNYLKNINGIPSVKWFGKDEINYYMVIDLLGHSLKTIKDYKKVFSLKATFQLGIQIVNLLKSIHEKGLIHRDIKPDNFLFGLAERKTQIFMIDFGLCKSFLNNDRTHIDMKKNQNLIGSQTYASINAHNYDELSRRDDLESVCYMLIYFVLGKLDWQNINTNINNKNTNTNVIIKQIKENITNIDKNDKQIPLNLITILQYTRTLKFKEEPDYDYIIDMLTVEINDLS